MALWSMAFLGYDADRRSVMGAIGEHAGARWPRNRRFRGDVAAGVGLRAWG